MSDKYIMQSKLNLLTLDFSLILAFSTLMIEGRNQFGQVQHQQNLQMSNMSPARYRVQKNRRKPRGH